LWVKTKKMLKFRDRLLLRESQDNFPLVSRPYLEIGKRLRLSEAEVISRLKILKKKKVIRYVGGIFNTKKLGIRSTLVAMNVPKQRLQKVAGIINAYPQISHNYLRNGRFNLWFTLSASSRKELLRLVRQIQKRTKVDQVLNLDTRKVFKIDARFGLLKNENR